MASFPANVYGGGCKRLRERLQCFASEMGKRGTEIASPILYKRKGGGKVYYLGYCSPPREYLINQEFAQPF